MLYAPETALKDLHPTSIRRPMRQQRLWRIFIESQFNAQAPATALEHPNRTSIRCPIHQQRLWRTFIERRLDALCISNGSGGSLSNVDSMPYTPATALEDLYRTSIRCPMHQQRLWRIFIERRFDALCTTNGSGGSLSNVDSMPYAPATALEVL